MKIKKNILIRSFSLLLYHVLVRLSGNWSSTDFQKSPSFRSIYYGAGTFVTSSLACPLRSLKSSLCSLRNSCGRLVANLGHPLSVKLNIEGRLTTTQPKKWLSLAQDYVKFYALSSFTGICNSVKPYKMLLHEPLLLDTVMITQNVTLSNL